jgi:hypothetical protein
VSGATVVWTGSGGSESAFAEYVVKSDGEGSYEVPDPDVWAGAVAVIHPDYGVSSSVRDGLKSSSPLRHELDAGKTLSGKIVGPSGSPVAGAALWIDGWPRGRTNADGTFLVPHGPSAPAVLLAKTDALVGTTRTGTGLLTITLTKGRTLTGVVREARSRAPLAGATITLMGDGASPSTTVVSDDHGRYSFAPLASGRYVASAGRVGYATTADDDEKERIIDLRRAASRSRDIVLEPLARLTGRVVDERQQPIDGALVSLLAKGSPTIYAAGDGFGMAATRTREDGTFHLTYDLEEGRTRMELPWPLVVLKEGFAAARIETVERGRGARPLVVTLVKGIVLEGRVVAEDGTPVPDVGVVMAEDAPVPGASVPAHAMLRRFPGESWVKTGPDGRFALEDLEPGAYDLFALKEGTGIRAMRQGELPAPDVRIELPSLGALRGRVVDSRSGAPVTSFAVVAAPPAADADWAGRDAESMSDASGQFVLRDVPLGDVTVFIRADGYLPKEAPAVVFPDADEAPSIEISLEAGVAVQGRVTTSTGQPLDEVEVSAAGNGSAGDTEVETDEDGRFRFPGLSPGTVTLHFQRRGYVSVRKSFDTADTTRVDVSLTPGLALKGVVLSDGAGVPHVYVGASSSAAGAADGSATSGEGGTFTIEGLTPGRYTVTASADEGGATIENVEVEKAGLLRLVLERKATSVLTGVVTGLPSGDAALFTRVTATGEDGRGGMAPVDSRGVFRMEKAPVGRVRVQAVTVATSGVSRSSRANDLTLAPGSESQTVLEFHDDVVISGRVTRDGSPASGGSILFRASDGTGGMASSRLGAGGDYELVGLEPGPYSVTVSGMGFSYATEYVVRESARFDIDATGASVKGQTVDAADGAPLSGVDVSLWREDETKPTESQKTGAKGEFVARGLREGRYRVLTSKKGYGQQVREIELEPGASADVVLELVGSEGLTVTVVDARDDRPLDATIVVRDLARRVVANQHSGVEADGSLTIPLAPGRYLLSTSAGGYGTTTVPVSAPGRGLRVGLTPGGTLVLDSERDLRGRIRLVKPDGEEYVRCWCNGIAEIPLTGRHTKVENVTPGTYAIQIVDHAGSTRGGPTVAIEEGRVATVTLE